jgi:hypothetical protein
MKSRTNGTGCECRRRARAPAPRSTDDCGLRAEQVPPGRAHHHGHAGRRDRRGRHSLRDRSAGRDDLAVPARAAACGAERAGRREHRHASLEGIRDMSEPRWSLPAGRQIRAARRRGAGGTRRQDLPHPGAVPRDDGVRRQVLGSQRASRCAPRPATPTVSPVRGSRIPPDGRLVLGRRERVTLPGRGKFRLPPRGRPRCPAAGASARHPLETNAHPCLHARGPTAAVLGHVAEAVGLRLTAGPTLPPGQREKRPRPTNASTTRTTTTITRMVQSILILRVGCSCERCPVADAEKHSR